MKQLLFGLLLIFSCLKITATAQYGERLIWNGDTVLMYSTPLQLNSQLYEKIQLRLFECQSTALRRGYIGEWAIENDTLFLIGINIVDCNDNFNISLKKVEISDLVKKYQDENGNIVASWVSDTLRVVSGECLEYIHMGWEGKFEKEWEIVVENGVVKSMSFYENIMLTEHMSEEEILKIIDEFPFEKYPSAQNLVVCINGAVIDDISKEISYDIDILFPEGRGFTEEEQFELYNVVQSFFKEKKIIPVYIYKGVVYASRYIIRLRKRR